MSAHGTAKAREDLIAKLIARADHTARAAGELLMVRPDDLELESKSTPTDIVTIMDKRSEALLVSMLLDGRPDDAVLGEEGADESGTSGVRWVIDPIDGTIDYMYGIPVWAVCIGIELDGEPVAGVVHAPALGETYLGEAGRGAVLRTAAGEQPLQVTTQADLSKALIGTGFGYAAARRRVQAGVIAEVLPQVRDIRRNGSAAIDLCWLAAGRLDGYFERGLQPWDHTAAGVIAREAGARFEGLHGSAVTEEFALAANPALFTRLHALLAPLDPAHD